MTLVQPSAFCPKRAGAERGLQSGAESLAGVFPKAGAGGRTGIAEAAKAMTTPRKDRALEVRDLDPSEEDAGLDSLHRSSLERPAS
jgi:hypothetical protein